VRSPCCTQAAPATALDVGDGRGGGRRWRAAKGDGQWDENQAAPAKWREADLLDVAEAAGGHLEHRKHNGHISCGGENDARRSARARSKVQRSGTRTSCNLTYDAEATLLLLRPISWHAADYIKQQCNVESPFGERTVWALHCEQSRRHCIQLQDAPRAAARASAVRAHRSCRGSYARDRTETRAELCATSAA
jgi:hypothetical protein